MSAEFPRSSTGQPDITAIQSLWRQQLDSGLAAMGLAAESAQRNQLLNYLALLLKWNRAYNLTAIRDPAQMVTRQLLDSLSIVSLVQGPRVLDVGSGAGLPGVPLAIMLPELSFTLLDTNSKKARFINQVRLELGLVNLSVEQQRVENYQPDTGFDCITSRAFATLQDMLQGSRHLLAEGGVWVAMKGQLPAAEIASLQGTDYQLSTRVLAVPGESGSRHAIIIH